MKYVKKIKIITKIDGEITHGEFSKKQNEINKKIIISLLCFKLKKKTLYLEGREKGS